MPIDTTLFAHIAPRLTDRIEDVAVDALGYILSNSAAARSALAEVLKDGGIRVGSIDRVETWEIGDEGEIPDLVCFDEKGVKHVLIEAKFWADLTKNQPNQYLNQLLEDRNGKSGALLFVAPRARLETLWPELCRRAEEKFELTVISKSGPVRSATIGNDIHHMQLTSWATLLERMASKANDAESDIGQLRGLTDRMDGDAFLPFRSEDLASESAQQMLDVMQLIDDATNHAKRIGWVDTEGLKAVAWETGYGRYIRIGGVETWFGVNFSGWARERNTPLWLSYWKGYHEQLEQTGLATRKFEIDDRYCIPIPLLSADHYNAALNSVVSELESIAKAFGCAGPAPALIDSDSLRSWRLKNLGPEFAERMLGVRRLVDDAANRATSQAKEDNEKWANIDELRLIIQARRTGYGRFIRIGGVKTWFGIHFGGWARHSNTPLWLTLDYPEQQKLGDVSAVTYKIDGKYCIPIELPAILDCDELLDSLNTSPTDAKSGQNQKNYDAALDSVVDSLKSIAKQFTSSGY
ncbi:MAG: hypothetical protein OXF86_19740 [Caldilineaceae bacterium]|nr:hypothetical protein [Caldilineaceae bacterium]